MLLSHINDARPPTTSFPLSLQATKKCPPALAAVAQWIEHWLGNPRVTGLIPSLEHTPGFQARYPVGGVQEATTH